MSKQLKNGKFQCAYCEKQYSRWQDADECYLGHDLLFIPMTSDDLGRLMMFIHLKDNKLLTETLMRTLSKFYTMRQPKS